MAVRRSEHGCEDCRDLPRRSFVQQLALAVAGLAIGLGIEPAKLAALPVSVGASVRHGDELTYPIPATDGATIDRDHDTILVRFQQKVYVFNLSCPHQHTALRWEPEDGQFQCPRHHSRYRPDGVYVSGRATRSMDRFGVRRDGGNVIADLNQYFRQDDNPAAWDGAFIPV